MITRADIARHQDRQERIVLAGGVRAVRGAVDRARRAALMAFKDGSALHAPQAARAALRAATPVVVQAMTLGHLYGRGRSIDAAAQAPRRAVALANPYQGATDFLRRRLDLSPAQVSEVAAKYSPMAARAVNHLGADVERVLQEKIAEILGRGLHVRQGVNELRQTFDELGLGGTPDAAEYRLETLFRTQHQIAYGAGRWQANESPEIREILWGYEYVTVRDDRVRPNHRALDGFKAPKDDPAWLRVWPPNGYNCRCEPLEIFHGQQMAVATGALGTIDVDGVMVNQAADPGWGWNAGRVIPSDLWSSAPLGPVRILE